MSRDRNSRRLPVIMTLLVGLMLTIMPLPASVEPFRPDWLALLLIFWAMQLPRTWSVGSAWIVGVILDVAQGTLLGQHALALSVIVFITVRFHLHPLGDQETRSYIQHRLRVAGSSGKVRFTAGASRLMLLSMSHPVMWIFRTFPPRETIPVMRFAVIGT